MAATTDPRQVVLYVHDVAAMLGKTEAQVRHMRARGQLPAPLKQSGLGLCWRRVDFEKWLSQLGR